MNKMKTTAALSVVLALLVAAPVLAKTHRHHQANAPAYGTVNSTFAVPTYPNEVPWAPF